MVYDQVPAVSIPDVLRPCFIVENRRNKGRKRLYFDSRQPAKNGLNTTGMKTLKDGS